MTSELLTLEERYRVQAALGYFHTTKWDLITSSHRESLMQTECTATCTGCSVRLRTEAAFAIHYYVPDVLYTNLGNCPVRIVNTKFVPCTYCTGDLNRADHVKGCPMTRPVCEHELCSWFHCGV
jgi:hypothetical protein